MDSASIYQAGRDQYLVGRDLHMHYSETVRRARPVGPTSDECPYPGLTAFGPDQERWFFGRDHVVASVITAIDRSLREGGALLVVAPSGAGKSSLLRAGVLPALARGGLDGSTRWPCLVFTPTARPLEVLARYLATVVGIEPTRVLEVLRSGAEASREMVAEVVRRRDEHLVLIVDQLEEIFTLGVDDHTRRRFLDILTHLTEPHDGYVPAAVVFGLRADFYASCADHAGLRAAAQRDQLFLGPLSDDELRAAITLPARDVGLDVEPGLVELLLADLGTGVHEAAGGDTSGRLPLLAHALRATWQQRHGHVLTVAGYRTTGGIRQAVATTAEGLFTRLDPAGQDVARSLFLRMVTIGRAEDTRRGLPLTEFGGFGHDPRTVWAVADLFARGRLITHDHESAEITHEALLSAWPRLRSWIDNDRAGNLVRQELETAAAAWDRDGRDPSALYRGSRLETVRSMVDPGDLSTTAAAFLAASSAAHQRAVHRRGLVLAALVVLSLVASLTAVVAIRQNGLARDARDRAVADRRTAVFNQITAEADRVRVDDASLAARLDLAAYRMDPRPPLRTKLMSSQNTPLSSIVHRDDGNVRAVDFSADGKILATGGQSDTVRLWNTDDPSRTTPLGTIPIGRRDTVVSLAFAPDSRILAVAGDGGLVQLWNAADPAKPVRLGEIAGHLGTVSVARFSPDGRILATAADDSLIRLWDVRDAAAPLPLGAPITGHSGTVFGVAFSPDGRTLAGVDDDERLRLWDIADPAAPVALGEPQVGHKGPVLSVAFSPDGRTVATGGFDRTVRLWDVAAPAAPRQLGQLTGHTSFIWSLEFAPDGRTLATASYDHRVQLWNVGQPDRPASLGRALAGHTGPVTSLAFSPDGRTVATGGNDHTARLWHLPTTTVVTGHTDNVEAVASSPDGRVLATGGADRTVRLWNAADLDAVAPAGEPLTGFGGSVTAVAFSPDGMLLAVSAAEPVVRLWNVADPARPVPLGVLDGHTGTVWTVAFSPDGRALATGDAGGSLRLWNVTDPAHPAQAAEVRRQTGPVYGLAFTPDGRTVATASGDRTVQLWNVGSLPPTAAGTAGIGAFRHTAPLWAVAFSPDGRTMVSAGEDGSLRLWDVADPNAPAELSVVAGHTNTVFAARFSPDGRTLVSGGQDDAVRLWDVTDPRSPVSLGPPLTAHTGTVFGAVFGPDGRTLVTAGGDRVVRVWRTDVDRVVERICATTRDVLTAQRWAEYVPGTNQPDCP
ncbi:nSTAND1 domain-containing NTPase [Saccharothrix violaceirubra]|uniref:WD40 repeat protein n=1 Tax=Saccharothrix violaceirubra TaxID=413306 RepID=A0A7W7WWW0_9PSEU|nr:hypothetical protein [Saccharothrix violaceirubra]MBB4966496.1 WD40 repeat protein [Saccharothrix violaceirubra]